MNKRTTIPEQDGLYWYFENGKDAPEPVLIDVKRFGRKFQWFNGAKQDWLRKGEYLIGPQPAPGRVDG